MSVLVEQYENLLISNLPAVRSIESGLRNVSWLLPGRFEDAELASEGLNALMNVVSGYHDTLVARHLDPKLSLPPHPFLPGADATTPPVSRTAPMIPSRSEHTRYTQYWTDRSSVYRKASRILATLSYLEILLEMVSRKRLGEKKRWKMILGLESFKTTLRLLILAITRRPVLTQPTPQREYDIVSLPASLLSTKQTNKDNSSEALSPDFKAPSQALTPTIAPLAPLRSHLYPMVNALPETHLQDPLTLMPELSSPGAWASEVIEASVVLLHVVLLIRASRKPKAINPRAFSLPSMSSAMSPYIITLSLALLSRTLRGPMSNSLLLAEHHRQLDRRLATRAFFTGPMWVAWTRPKLLGVVKRVERIPLVGVLGEFVEGYFSLVDDYFYYTS